MDLLKLYSERIIDFAKKTIAPSFGNVFRSRGLYFNLDSKPESSDREISLLRGWVLWNSLPTELIIKVDGTEIIRFHTFIPRPDLIQYFPKDAASTLCGFELCLIREHLEKLGRDAIQLCAVCGDEEKIVWSLESREETSDPSILEQCKELLLTSYSYLPRKPRNKNDFGKIIPLHIVIDGSRSLFNQGNLITTLAESCNGNNLDIKTLSLLLPDTRGKNIENYIASESIPKTLPPIKLFPNNGNWHEYFADCSAPESELVLFLDSSFDLKYANLNGLVNAFKELPNIAVLMPTIYGGRRGLAGPSGVNLFDLCSLRHGEVSYKPVLANTKIPNPVWLSTVSYLNFVSRDKGFTGLGLPVLDIPIYHLDLRQPITCVSGDREERNTRPERERLQACVREYLPEVSDILTEKQIVVILISNGKEWGEVLSGNEYQIAELGKNIKSEGYYVLFSHIGDKKVKPYINGFYSWHYADLSHVLEDNKNVAAIIASSWDTVPAANVLRYCIGGEIPIAKIIQELPQREFSEILVEKREEAGRAFRSIAVPIVHSRRLIADFPDDMPGRENCIFVPPVFDKTRFSNLPFARKQASVLVLVDNEIDIEVYDFLLAVVEELKKSIKGIYITISPLGIKKNRTLIECVDESYSELDTETLARLLATNTLLLDFRRTATTALSQLEVLASGILPVWYSRTGCAEIEGEELKGCFIDSLDKDNCLKKVQQLINDNRLRETLLGRTAEVSTFKQEIPYPRNIISAISSQHKTMAERLKQQWASNNAFTVIVPVHNALDSTSACLRRLKLFLPELCRVVIVDDASDRGTKNYLEEFCNNDERFTLVILKENLGFVGAVKEGLQVVPDDHDVVLLNSDVFVESKSLSLLRKAAYARFNVGASSCLSTNSPHLQIDLNKGDSLDTAAKKLRKIVTPTYPTVITPEGQCLYIRRFAINQFGFLDSVFGKGFCEESDLCMRFFCAGVDLNVADNALIVHERHASFGKSERNARVQENFKMFEGRWGKYYHLIYQTFLKRDPLRLVRNSYASIASELERPYGNLNPETVISGLDEARTIRRQTRLSKVDILDDVQVVFVLPVAVYGGGPLSVLQHVEELSLRGIEARVLVLNESGNTDLPHLAPAIPVSIEQFFELNWGKQKVIATFWTTAYLVHELVKNKSSLSGYYYVQDYEPWFHNPEKEFLLMRQAEKSYHLGLKHVVKTRFLSDLLKDRHGVEASIITPGLKRTIFYPGEQDRLNLRARPKLTAMYRDSTSRRGGDVLRETISLVKDRLPELEINIFGKLDHFEVELDRLTTPRGILSPKQVAALYRETDVVLDLSYWQGFGRMGLEGMACGAVPVLSRSGGIDTYARDEENCLLVEPGNAKEAASSICRLIKHRDEWRYLREGGIATAGNFSEEQAVNDWLGVFGIPLSKTVPLASKIDIVARPRETTPTSSTLDADQSSMKPRSMED